MVKLAHEGKTQADIAQRFGLTQGYVSKLLSDFEDSTDTAKQYLRGSALSMAQNIVKKGRAADHVAALKGLSVLEEQQHSGVTVIVGGGGTVNVGVMLSPSSSLPVGETLQIPQQKALVSDKEDYVNEANSLTHQE